VKSYPPLSSPPHSLSPRRSTRSPPSAPPISSPQIHPAMVYYSDYADTDERQPPSPPPPASCSTSSSAVSTLPCFSSLTDTPRRLVCRLDPVRIKIQVVWRRQVLRPLTPPRLDLSSPLFSLVRREALQPLTPPCLAPSHPLFCFLSGGTIFITL
jgi:hypothetical protein